MLDVLFVSFPCLLLTDFLATSILLFELFAPNKYFIYKDIFNSFNIYITNDLIIFNIVLALFNLLIYYIVIGLFDLINSFMEIAHER